MARQVGFDQVVAYQLRLAVRGTRGVENIERQLFELCWRIFWHV